MINHKFDPVRSPGELIALAIGGVDLEQVVSHHVEYNVDSDNVMVFVVVEVFQELLLILLKQVQAF